MPSIVVISPKKVTHSAKRLADSLGARHVNPYDTKTRDFTNYDYVVNYGFSRPIHAKNIINKTMPINIALDKLETFAALDGHDGINVPYTLDLKQAMKWLEEDGVVCARSKTKGSNGDGLAYATNFEEASAEGVKFWTRFIEHTNEFRVNCWKNQVIAIYDKTVKTVKGEPVFEFKLWQGQEKHPQLVDLVDKMYKRIGLDWCGIDLLRDKAGKLHVLEINSAPALRDFTLNKLSAIIKKETNNG